MGKPSTVNESSTREAAQVEPLPVEARRPQRLNLAQLERAFGTTLVQEVLDEASERRERDHIGYANEALSARAAAGAAGAVGAPAAAGNRPSLPPLQASDRMLCDACGRPEWVNALSVKDGLAVCSTCNTPRPEEDRRGVDIDFSRCERVIVPASELEAMRADQRWVWDAMVLTPDEQRWVDRVVRLTRDIEHAARKRLPGTVTRDGVRAEIETAIKRLGPRPAPGERRYAVYLRRESHDRKEQTMTPLAERVRDYWRRQMGGNSV